MSAKETAKKVGRFVFLLGAFNQRNMTSLGLVILFAILYVILGGKIEIRPLDQKSIINRQVQEPVRPKAQQQATPPATPFRKSEEAKPKEDTSSAVERLKRLREATKNK